MSFLTPLYLAGAALDRAADRAAPAAARRRAAGAVHRRQPAAEDARSSARGRTGCATCCCSRRASPRCCCWPARSRGRTCAGAPPTGADDRGRRRSLVQHGGPGAVRARPRAGARGDRRRRRAIASRSSPSTIAPRSCRRPAPPPTRAPRSPRSRPASGEHPLRRRVRQGGRAPARTRPTAGWSSSAICSAAASTRTARSLPEGIDLQVRDAGAATSNLSVTNAAIDRRQLVATVRNFGAPPADGRRAGHGRRSACCPRST